MKNQITYMFITVFFFSSAGYSQPGNLDSDFSGDGIALVSFEHPVTYATSVAVQSDGKIVLAGGVGTSIDGYTFGIARLTPDGLPDYSFSYDGLVTTAYDNFYDNSYCSSVIIQPDGKIIAAGRMKNNFALVRYNTDGTLDHTFDDDGKALSVVYEDNSVINSVKLLADGKIVVAGSIGEDFGAARYNSNGSIDSSFGNHGIARVDITGNEDVVSAMEIQNDGKIVIAGAVASENFDFGLLRLNSDGTIDSSFNYDGRVITDISGSTYDQLTDIKLQPDGKIVAAGFQHGTYDAFAMARYNTDGSLDLTFDGDGKVITQAENTYYSGNALTIQPDGKIIIGGWSMIDGVDEYTNFALMRYSVDGMIDSSFGVNGLVTTIVGSEHSKAYDLILQPDGRILLFGDAMVDDQHVFAVTRYLSGLQVGIIDKVSDMKEMLIYPNPLQSNNILQYELQNPGLITVSLADIQGRHIKTFVNQEYRQPGMNEEEINISGISTGNYILNIRSEKGQESIKVVIK